MKNIGIVIAVSTYDDPKNNLPACAADGEAIYSILETESRFDEVLYIREKTTSRSVKNRLVEFFKQSSGTEIGDLFFYFTGHGVFSDGEFYYPFSDYDPQRRKQTSLENTELDSLARNLNPRNFVKVVDACYSGQNYIKDFSGAELYLRKQLAEFQKLYFMYSSQQDQPSFQDESLSFFTRMFVKALGASSNGVVRYKDIIDYISDQFSSETPKSQTPLFVIQADFVEEFCTMSDSLRAVVRRYAPEGTSSETAKLQGVAAKPILTRIQEDAQLYCEEIEVFNVLQSLADIVRETKLSGDLEDFYALEFSEIDSSEIPNAQAIGEWLDRNLVESKYFVEIIKIIEKMSQAESVADSARYYSTVIYPSQRSSWFPIGQGLLGGTDLTIAPPQAVSGVRYLPKVTGFRSTVDLPYRCLELSTRRKYPNIDDFAFYLVPIVSKTRALLFWDYSQFEDVGWSERKIGDCNWSNIEIELRSKENHLLWKEMSEGFLEFVRKQLDYQWGGSPASDSGDDTGPIEADISHDGEQGH